MSLVVNYAVVAIGGACGAMLRYAISLSALGGWSLRFPFPTFVINVSGSFCFGFIVALLTDRIGIPAWLRLALTTGFLGAFTTFSTFEYETVTIWREHGALWSVGYLTASILCGALGLLLGETAAHGLALGWTTLRGQAHR
ncbi:MAG: fluoride efflux transporter CrcB [Chloracidobacterium sp.]|uniref:Fluoride-specific ion channel FluC n=1 Tax=Chloracidobacterium validum TaxID=2821543 RepID=A0ABX8BBZ8_9BACT|nr:fluoride efflux transporter CrcB [Chloracidobacterium validum]QUW03163.1 fluoride efflux transporter CrcB [Chloracidobacterium validum]